MSMSMRKAPAWLLGATALLCLAVPGCQLGAGQAGDSTFLTDLLVQQLGTFLPDMARQGLSALLF